MSYLPEWPDALPVPLQNRQHTIDALSYETLMDSARLRKRRASLQPREVMQVTWNFTQDEFSTFRDFFNEDLENGELSFLISLEGDSTITELSFLEAKYAFQRSDNLYAVMAVLEVLPDDTVVPAGLTELTGRIPFKWFNGPVYAILPMGQNVYVSGRFTQYGTTVDGWDDCLGIVRILKTGEIDTTFQPGGVAGGGFGISGGYFPPTQLQGAIDGGVFCGMSFAFLEEPLLYENRSDATILDEMLLNGVAVPCLVKLKANGSRDLTFETDYLVGAATNPKFFSFHMYEQIDRCYTSQARDVTCLETGTTADFSGVNYSCLECRTLSGSFKRRAFRTIPDMATSASYAAYVLEFQQVFVDEAVGIVYWGGQIGNSLLDGGLVITEHGDETQGRPWSWRVFDLNSPATYPGLLCFDLGLNFLEAANWIGYDRDAVETDGLLTTMAPYRITRGCFRGSIAGSERVVGDSGAQPEEGSWASGGRCRHKGCLHYNFNQRFDLDNMQIFTDQPVMHLTFSGSASDIWSFRGYGSYGSGGGSTEMDLYYAKDTPNEAVIFPANGGEFYSEATEEQTTGVYTLDLIGSFVHLAHWEICIPAYKLFVDAPTDHWDLRSANPAADTEKHGFDPFAGFQVDYDGCHNCRVLKAQHDGTLQADSFTSQNLGVFVTGMIEKFKNVTVFAEHGQLAKIRHNGEWDSSFVCPVFGPATFALLEDIETGASETHHNKINCATPSMDGSCLYVGGKFKQVVVDSVVQVVGHIVCLDINTGEVLS